jgi:hypothetical protein
MTLTVKSCGHRICLGGIHHHTQSDPHVPGVLDISGGEATGMGQDVEYRSWGPGGAVHIKGDTRGQNTGEVLSDTPTGQEINQGLAFRLGKTLNGIFRRFNRAA